MTKKEQYEKPEVTKVDFKFEEAIAASECSAFFNPVQGECNLAPF